VIRRVGDGYKQDLRRAYDADAARRAERRPDPWRVEIVDGFVARARAAGGSRIVELGCGTGQVAERLAAAGLDPVAVDLSPANAVRAAQRDVTAIVADFARLPVRDGAFDAALAFNSLLHVPRDRLPDQFREIRRVLRHGAVVVSVTWGGATREGPIPDEWLEPPRYFSLLSDDDLAAVPTPGFARVELRPLPVRSADLHPQVLVLRAV
jgi:SAM-dependent methyltransferase